MNFEPLLILVIAVLLAFVAVWAIVRFFSTEARLERRRRRSNSPIAKKARRPMVKFSVRTKKD